MQESTVKTYQILAKSWNSTKWLKTELVAGLPFFQGQVWDFTGNLGDTLPCFCFVQSRIFNSWDVWISFCEHLDHPNYPRLFRTKEDNKNEETQSWVPGNQAAVAVFHHYKKIIKAFKWHLLFQSESLAHVPVEVITFQIHTGADGNFVMAQWCRKKLAVRFNKVTSRHRNHCKICSFPTWPARWGINVSLIGNSDLRLISKRRKSFFNQNNL